MTAAGAERALYSATKWFVAVTVAITALTVQISTNALRIIRPRIVTTAAASTYLEVTIVRAILAGLGDSARKISTNVPRGTHVSMGAIVRTPLGRTIVSVREGFLDSFVTLTRAIQVPVKTTPGVT